MKCEDVREQLLDHLWTEALEPERAVRIKVERHLEACPACKQERAQLEALWSRLEGLGNDHGPEVPSEQLRNRFYEALADHRRRLGRPPRWRRWLSLSWLKGPENSRGGALQPAWSLATLALGVALGASLMWTWSVHSQIERLSAEVDSMNRAVSLSLLDHQSASERLRGVSWSARALGDDRIVEALLESLTSDPNVNVRLAALETLARLDSPRVSAGLLEALPRENSPVLQVALVDVLNRRSAGAEIAIEKFLTREDLDQEVRTQIRHLRQSV